MGFLKGLMASFANIASYCLVLQIMTEARDRHLSIPLQIVIFFACMLCHVPTLLYMDSVQKQQRIPVQEIADLEKKISPEAKGTAETKVQVAKEAAELEKITAPAA